MIGAKRRARLTAGLGLLCMAVMVVGLGVSSADSTAVESAISQAESIALPSGYEQYFYVGSTAGGKPMESTSWSPDLAVTASSSGYQAISIGRSASDGGSYSSSAGTDAIAGASVTGYQVEEVVHESASAMGPGSEGGPETRAAGESLELKFSTQPGDLVLILVGGQGTGELQLSGITATTLQNATYSAGSHVLASAAIYEAALPGGNYTASWTSTTYLTNSGTSLGAVAYVLQPSSSTDTDTTTTDTNSTTNTNNTTTTTPTSRNTSPPVVSTPTGETRPPPPHSHSLAPVAMFSPLFTTRADLTGRSLGVLLGIPSITGVQAGSTVTVRCRHTCAHRLTVVRHIHGRSSKAIQLPRALVLRSGTVIEISVSQPGHTARFAEYRFRRTSLGVVPYGAGRGCIDADGKHRACE